MTKKRRKGVTNLRRKKSVWGMEDRHWWWKREE